MVEEGRTRVGQAAVYVKRGECMADHEIQLEVQTSDGWLAKSLSYEEARAVSALLARAARGMDE